MAGKTFVSARVISNRLPTIARQLGMDTDFVMLAGAEMTQRLWSEDVRVSDGPGNYHGLEGGTAGHYRDNIFIQKLGQNSWTVSTPVFYSIFNEFGGGPLSPRPSAEQAANQGFEWIVAELTSRIRDWKSITIPGVLRKDRPVTLEEIHAAVNYVSGRR